MVDHFSEKASQCSVNRFEVFGIEIHSRYSKVDEFIPMMEFVKICVEENVSSCIKSVFFDSSACFPCVTIFDHRGEDDYAVKAVTEIAKNFFFHTLIQNDQWSADVYDEEPA